MDIPKMLEILSLPCLLIANRFLANGVMEALATGPMIGMGQGNKF